MLLLQHEKTDNISMHLGREVNIVLVLWAYFKTPLCKATIDKTNSIELSY